MGNISILGQNFPVTNVEIPCVSGKFFSTQTWSDTRIYSLLVSESDLAGKSYEELLNDLDSVCEGVAMRNNNKHHVPILDADIRSAILGKMGKTTSDFTKAVEESDDTFFQLYDKYLLELFVGKKLKLCKVTLSVATLTNGAKTTYKSRIGDNVTDATGRDVYDFASAIEKSVISAAADILAAIEDEEDDEEE